MSDLLVSPASSLRGTVRVPGDKSISHRALLLGSLAEGPSLVGGFLPASDCQATLRCLRALGVEIEDKDGGDVVVHGGGLHGYSPPTRPLDCASSGTTMRLLSGILAGQPFRSVLTGSPQLQRRPMARIAVPLRQMGASIADVDGHAPLVIEGDRLSGITTTLQVASAQVKSAILLAGLFADGPTAVREPSPARDHTERLLIEMGADLSVKHGEICLNPGRPLQAVQVAVPGDISSGLFLLAAALLVHGSLVELQGIGVNPTRTGALEVLHDMGAEITVTHRRQLGAEPVADITARAGSLRATAIGGDLIPRLIDELPLLALVATQAQGVTRIRDAADLRSKESDRIASTVTELRKLGARIEPLADGMEIQGPTPLRGAEVDSHRDHRMAMTLVIAGLLADGETRVSESDCIADSFPGFLEAIVRLGGNVT